MLKRAKEDNKNLIDQLIVVICLGGVLFLSLPLVSSQVFNFLFGNKEIGLEAPIIGSVLSVKNDIRHKSKGSLVWNSIKMNKKLQQGDSVFTGENSQSQLGLQNGSILDLNQNSLVTFTEIDQLNVPNLAIGNFKLVMSGKVKVAIGGQITELEGDKSELEVVVTKEEKPKVRLLKGQITVQEKNGKKRKLEKKIATKEKLSASDDNLMEMNLSEEPVAEIHPVDNKPPEIKPPQKPTEPTKFVINNLENISRIDEIYDYYKLENNQLTLRTEKRSFYNFPVEVSFQIEGEKPKMVFAQLSQSPEFLSVGVTASAPIINPETSQKINLSQVFLQKNYVRLSSDGQKWSDPKSFDLLSGPLEVVAPDVKTIPSKKVYLLEEYLKIKFQPILKDPLLFAVVEISDSSDFLANSTKVYWRDSTEFEINVIQEGSLHFRARGVNEKNQITEYGPVETLEIIRPESPKAPIFAEKKIKSKTEDRMQISVKKRPEKKLDILPGRKFERTFASTVSKDINQTTMKLEPSIPDYLNRHYKDSRFSFEGSASTVHSQKQIEDGVTSPRTITAGLRSLHWWNLDGFEGVYKTKLFSALNSTDSDVSPTNVEARYHRRLFLHWSPFSSYNSSQISGFAGYEVYRNSAGGPFVPKYDLIKLGTAMTFPMASNWDTGGELVYGIGFDKSAKYEISGFMSYYLSKDWNLGAGYRAHFFNAGSTTSSPASVPYREGYIEGYSVLRYNY